MLQLHFYAKFIFDMSLFLLCRQLKAVYPHYPSIDEFTHDLLLKVGNTLCKSDEDLFVITQFAISYDRLCLIGTLLPDLIKFYQWIHTELVLHRVTWNYAATQTLDYIITRICGKDTEIAKLFERVYGKQLYHDR